MKFEEFLVDDNSENNENNDILDNILENVTNPTSNIEHYKGEIRPYMFEPGLDEYEGRNNSDNNDQVKHHKIPSIQKNSIQATKW